LTELLFRDDAYVRQTGATVVAVTHIMPREGDVALPALILDRTVCYFESGGQPGDTATITWAGGSAAIVDTRRQRDSGEILHVLAPSATPPAVGEAVQLSVDWQRRYTHMRYHTALHLVCAALPGILATGNSIDAGKARIDFDLSGVEFDRDATEARLNALIAGDHDVVTQWITDAEMAAQPALVRTMSVAPPTGAGRVRLLKIGDGVDLQPCGGTHVRSTREIGPVKITKVENKGKQNRRLVLQLQAP
jgi:misacylated tRNA(Ala) deacylase